ncbi:MAG: DegV family protein [Tractidigestivibacter sp.]|uniref:DegV family protein n=1 Tax=Tractidigestivibacter sp. TaxID=2847320 RepID=UPI003D8F85E9
MNSQRIAVITDSGTDTPAQFAREHDVRIVPLRINFSDGSSYESGVTITGAQLIERLQHEIPTTSLPSPATIRQTFDRAKEDGYEGAVFVSISSGLSATNNTARMVAEQMENFPVVVIDTKSIGIGAGMLVMETVREIEAGVPLSNLEATVSLVASRSSIFFSVKSLDYLRAGGRISEAVYRIGSVLNIKPVITCNEEGRYVVAKKSRGWERSIDTQVSLIEQEARKYNKVRIALCCSDACQMFDELEAKVSRQVDNAVEFVRSGVSPDLLVHTGPYLVGIGIQPVA